MAKTKQLQATDDIGDVFEPPSTEGETILGIPIDRFVSFVGPYISIGSGAIADWLLVHVHLLSTFHVTSNGIVGAATQVAVWAVTSGLVWLGHRTWLKGRHIEIANQGLIAQAQLATALAQYQGAPNHGLIVPPATSDEIQADAQAGGE